MTIPHFISRGGAVEVVTVFDETRPNPVLTADANHPHYQAILDGLLAGDESVYDLFDVAGGVMRRFQQITDRVTWDGTNVRLDGDVVHSAIADQIRRTIETGEQDYRPLVRFWEKLESNPNEHSRQQAYDFLAAHTFQITEDGDVVGFKGVTRTVDGEFVSGWSSQVPDVPSAYVDGEPVPPQSVVPNKVGTVVTMPRGEVIHDPTQACRRGLHVSTRSYAEAYGRNGAVLEVHVNPRDIVSVPTDGGGEKVRVCRYRVARVALDSYSDRPVLRDNDKTPSWAGDVGYRV